MLKCHLNKTVKKMNDLVKIIIRKENYDIFAINGKTDDIFKFIYSSECFYGNEDIINQYIEINELNIVDTLEPVGEGIVVFDLKTKTLIVSTNLQISVNPQLLFNNVKNKIDFNNSSYQKEDILRLIENGHLKSLKSDILMKRLSFTGIKNYDEFENKLQHYCKSFSPTMDQVVTLEIEIATNHFDRFFWSTFDLPDVRLKMKELGIVFHKRDEELWSRYLTDNVEDPALN